MIKKIVKSEKFIKILAKIILLYLKFCFLTSKKQVFFEDTSNDEISNSKSTIFLSWHNQLSMSPFIINYFSQFKIPNLYFLASPHSDGLIISYMLKFMGGRIIAGSTNKSPVKALKEIIQTLQNNNNIALTPDGPRGPVYKINSNITEIAARFNYQIMNITFYYSRYNSLKSWDKFKIPLPFGKIIIKFSKFHDITGIIEKDKEKLSNFMQKNYSSINESL